MIAIVNVGKTKYNHNGIVGDYNYMVYINERLITTFTHRRSEGLGLCLSKAAKAVMIREEEDKKKKKETIMICPECGSKMTRGMMGLTDFWDCTNSSCMCEFEAETEEGEY